MKTTIILKMGGVLTLLKRNKDILIGRSIPQRVDRFLQLYDLIY
jgi:hypothetical protein